MPPSTEKQVFKNVIVVKIGIVSFNIFHVFKLQPLRVAPQTPTTACMPGVRTTFTKILVHFNWLCFWSTARLLF